MPAPTRVQRPEGPGATCPVRTWPLRPAPESSLSRRPASRPVAVCPGPHRFAHVSVSASFCPPLRLGLYALRCLCISVPVSLSPSLTSPPPAVPGSLQLCLSPRVSVSSLPGPLCSPSKDSVRPPPSLSRLLGSLRSVSPRFLGGPVSPPLLGPLPISVECCLSGSSTSGWGRDKSFSPFQHPSAAPTPSRSRLGGWGPCTCLSCEMAGRLPA